VQHVADSLVVALPALEIARRIVVTRVVSIASREHGAIPVPPPCRGRRWRLVGERQHLLEALRVLCRVGVVLVVALWGLLVVGVMQQPGIGGGSRQFR
jgi:hypothetical protein